MIISRTPYRISFFGGGTDYPAWYKEHGGSVLSTTIDKYCYLTCRYLPPYFEHKYRVVYSKIESIKRIEDIQHLSIRECLLYMNIKSGVEIHHDGDMPARAGIGSSSSFTVGLINALHALKGKMINKLDLAKTAIHVEQDLNKENVGSQDQTAASFGGFNKIIFSKNGDIQVNPVTISKQKLKFFQEHFMLYFTGFSRTASEIAKHQIKNLEIKKNELNVMHQMVDESINFLNSNNCNFNDFGKLLHENWKLKRTLTDKISNNDIDSIYEKALKYNAIGGKLLGAGGGGFILFFVEPEKKMKFRENFKNLLEVPFNFEDVGSQIIFYQPNEYGFE